MGELGVLGYKLGALYSSVLRDNKAVGVGWHVPVCRGWSLCPGVFWWCNPYCSAPLDFSPSPHQLGLTASFPTSLFFQRGAILWSHWSLLPSGGG